MATNLPSSSGRRAGRTCRSKIPPPRLASSSSVRLVEGTLDPLRGGKTGGNNREKSVSIHFLSASHRGTIHFHRSPPLRPSRHRSAEYRTSLFIAQLYTPPRRIASA